MIGKDVNIFNWNLQLLHSEDNSQGRSFILSESDNFFFPVRIKGGIVNTDENEKIHSIFIEFEKIIDEKFYNYLVENYGPPDKIYCKDIQ